MKLIFKNNLGKGVWEYEVSDRYDSNLFYHFDIVLKDNMPDGEYTVQLVLEDEKFGFQVLSETLAQVGCYKPTKTEYQPSKPTESNGFKQYNG